MVTLSEVGRYTGQRFFPALAHKDFRLLWTAILASDSSTWALTTVRAWLAKSLAQDHSNTWVGITIFSAMLPFVIFPPFAGYLADRVVRRNLLAFIFVVSLGQSVALTVLALSGELQLWHLVLLSFVNGAARAAQTPTAYSLVANLVPREQMLNAYALNAAVFHASRLVGPGLIAPLMAAVDPGWVFFCCNFPFLIGLFQVLRIQTVSTGAMEHTRGVLYNLTAGLKYCYSHGVLSILVLLIAFHCALTMSFESLLPIISDERFNWEGSGVAYLIMSVGAGALVSSVYLAGIRGEQFRGRILFVTGLLSALTPLTLAVAPNIAIGMLSAACMGASQTAYMVITLTMIQSMVPDGIRGRISSIYIIHAGGIMAFANLANGALADFVDPKWLLTFAGLAFLAVNLLSAVGPTMRRIYWSGLPVQATAT